MPDLKKSEAEKNNFYRRGQTQKDFKMLDEIKETNLKTNLIAKYIPNFGAAASKLDEHGNRR